MVGSRKLSNEEVEALLGGLEADKKKSTAATFDPNEVREFKFGSEDLSLLMCVHSNLVKMIYL